jgi:hypothetical protein
MTPRLGGGELDDLIPVATDGSGHVAVAGYFRRTVTSGAHSITAAGTEDHEDALVGVIDGPSGTIRWLRRGGGALGDQALGVAFDSTGTLHAVGFSRGPVDLGAGLDPLQSGGDDTFLVSYRQP